MHQVVPGGLDNPLVPLQLQIVVFFKLLDAPLEFGKAAAHVCEFPVVLKLHTDILFCEATIQQGDPGRPAAALLHPGTGWPRSSAAPPRLRFRICVNRRWLLWFCVFDSL
jgi:hypothetical protein